MLTQDQFTISHRQGAPLTLFSASMILIMLVGCGGPSAAELETVDYTPITRDEWPVSTPEEQGLKPELVAQLYYNASQLESIYSLLVFKNGYLIAEDYFHIGSPHLQVNIHSVTKSITSALVGIALKEGCLTSLDQKMMDFFPELQDQITDARKNEIALLDDLDLLVVVLVDPLHGQHGDEPWRIEKSKLNLVADSVASLLGE